MTLRLRRYLAGALAGLLVAGLPASSSPAADSPAAATGVIALTAASPTTLTRSTAAMDLAGGLTNSSSALWENVRLEVRASGSVITTRASLTQWTDASLVNTSLAATTLASIDIGTVAGDATRSWRITVPQRMLTTVATRDGVLPLELVARDGRGQTVARLRTAVPVLISENRPTPTPVVLMVPLTWVPDRVASGRFLSTQLLTDIRAEGRLAQALDVGARAVLTTPPVRVTYLVDAALLDAVADLADGAAVREGDQWRDLTDDERTYASSWLTRASNVLGEQDVVALPYATVDVDALLREGQRVSVLGALERGERVVAEFLNRTQVPTAVWLGTGARPETLAVLANAGIRTVVVPASAVPAVTEPFYTPSGSTDLPVDGGTSLRATLLEDTLSARWQRSAVSGVSVDSDLVLLADLLLTTLQLPTTARTQVISLPLTMSTNSGVVDVVTSLATATAFATTVPLTRVLAQPAGSTVRQSLSTSPTDADAVLPARYVSAVETARARMRVVLAIAADPDQAQTLSDQVLAGLDGAASITLRSRAAVRTALLDGITEVLTGYETGVSVVSGRRLALSGERGVIPLTVRNDLPFTVRVDLRLIPTSPARFRVVESPRPLVVQPGERASVQVPVQVLGTDPVTVTARLVTPGGVAIGIPATIDVRTAAYARVATYVVAGAFVLLLLLIVRNAVRRIRRRREPVSA